MSVPGLPLPIPHFFLSPLRLPHPPSLAFFFFCGHFTFIITAYNYDQALYLSILFYEAQRSGKLPSNNRIPWREDSALNDKGLNGEDLTGGFYDDGGFIKFGLPQAWTITVLTFGLLEYWEAYESAGELNNMLDLLR